MRGFRFIGSCVEVPAFTFVFRQTGAIRDYVFPIAAVRGTGKERAFQRVLGSAFLIGNRGFALTAKHVIVRSQSEQKAGVFAPESGEWYGFDMTDFELHPSEDVAVIRLTPGPWQSIFQLSNSFENSGCKYHLFAYPDDTTFELIMDNQVVARPDLIYNEGYIRRRFSGTLPAITGTSFFELSEVAGLGASGAPVFKIVGASWRIIGVYVGEKINDRASSVAYATREEAFRNWTPEILGKSILEESQNVSIPPSR